MDVPTVPTKRPGSSNDDWIAAGYRGDQTGRAYLEKRSRLLKQLSQRPSLRRVLVIDDTELDAKVLSSLLRNLLGDSCQVDCLRALHQLAKTGSDDKVDLIFLDDRLGHVGSANTSIPALRKLGYDCPIVIVSGLLTRGRQLELAKLGTEATLHKDQLNSLAIMEILLKTLDPGPAQPTA